VKGLDHAQLLAERARPFEVEADAEAPAALGRVDVGQAVYQHVTIRMPLHELAEVSQHAQVLLEARQVEADVERDHREPGLPAALELRQERVVRTQRHAGVVVPDNGVRPPGSIRLAHRSIVIQRLPRPKVNSADDLHNSFLSIDARGNSAHSGVRPPARRRRLSSAGARRQVGVCQHS
jgi:hypothetical protein